MSEKPVPQPHCPRSLRVTDHVPMAHVNNVDQSIEFYTLLGFSCDSRFSDEKGEPYFAAMRNEQAEIMLTRASSPIQPEQQAVLFYMYANDVQGLRKHLLANGLVDAGRVPGERRMGDQDKPIPSGICVFDVIHPIYMTEGELRVHDPDGYVILIGQTARRRKGSGSIAQVAITVSEVEAAIRFYRDIIGLGFLFAAGPNLAFLTDGALRVMLSTPQGAGKIGANSVLYFKVDQIESTFAAMVEKGAVAERSPQFVEQMPDHQLWIGFLRDPDGNLVGIMEEKKD